MGFAAIGDAAVELFSDGNEPRSALKISVQVSRFGRWSACGHRAVRDGVGLRRRSGGGSVACP